MTKKMLVTFDGNKGLRGRPTKYDPSWHPQMVYKIALLGLTGKEMAHFFDIAESTYELWKIKHPDFSESIKRGGIYADALVAEKLYERALGYVYKTQQVVKVKTGKNMEVLEVVELRRELPPDTKAAVLWLTNRQRRYWKARPVAEDDSAAGGNVIEIMRQARERLNRGIEQEKVTSVGASAGC